jgi:hypothetical protein
LHGTHLSGTPKASTDLSEVRYLLPIEIKALGEQKQISPFVEQVLRDAGILADDISAEDPYQAAREEAFALCPNAAEGGWRDHDTV